MNRGFLQTVNYASVNEDWRAEAEGLRLIDGARALTITGSGDRALDLLAFADVDVVSIDAVPAQNHLLRLKMAALHALPPADYLGFLGLRAMPAAERLRRLDALPLPVASRAWWSGRRRLVARGVVYQGRFERYFRAASWAASWVFPGLVRDLFATPDLASQQAFLRDRWDRPAWRRVFGWAVAPSVSRWLYGDPAWYSQVSVSPGEWLFDRFTAGLGRVRASESFMAGLVLRGALPDGDLPPYLDERHLDVIRSRLHRVRVVDGDLRDALRGGERFDRFSLSDVGSYLDTATYHQVLRDVVTAAHPGARVVAREFLRRHPLPEGVVPGLIRDPALEARLADLDRAFCYTFVVGEVGDARKV